MLGHWTSISTPREGLARRVSSKEMTLLLQPLAVGPGLGPSLPFAGSCGPRVAAGLRDGDNSGSYARLGWITQQTLGLGNAGDVVEEGLGWQITFFPVAVGYGNSKA